MRDKLGRIFLVLLMLTFTWQAVAQVSGESSVRGNLAGTVYDTTGAVVPGAKVTITGPIGTKTIESDAEGKFVAPLLTPGFYSVKVEKQGFKIADVKSVEVATGRTTSMRLNLETGAVTETVEVTAAAVTVDTASTAVGANLNDTFYNQVPVARGVTGLFFASPGVTSGGGGTIVNGNPSIAGGSALENQYVADGVSITDGAFGGIGVFSRVYGSLSTGINLSFVKEVQVKTGGYEPQYGKSTGGVVQIVTKSGGRDYHGAVTGYFQPSSFESQRLHADDFNLFNPLGKVLHQYGYDVSGEIGGYVPGFRDNVFFFGSFNPSWNRSDLEFDDLHGITPTPGAGLLAPMTNKITAYNYAAKGTIRLGDSHQVEASIFGDPSRTLFQSNGDFTQVINDTGFDQLAFGTRNIVGRYNGTLSPTWLLNASVSWGHNYLSDTPLTDVHQIQNLTARDPRPTLNCASEGTCTTTGLYFMQGFGYIENTTGENVAFNVDTNKTFHFGGEHTFSIGYRYDKSSYDGTRLRTGGRSPIPAFNYAGDPIDAVGGTAPGITTWAGLLQDGTFQLRRNAACTDCPMMNVPGFGLQHVFLWQTRGVFSDPEFNTDGTYHTLYVNDSWSPWKYLTLNLGLRWEQQYLQGTLSNYTFTGNWSPRIGVSVDPWGDRKTKIYTNFGRYNYALPLDLAIRSLSGESSLGLLAWAPPFVRDPLNPDPGNGACSVGGGCVSLVDFNADGTITPVLDAGHLMSDPNGFGGGRGIGAAFGPAPAISAATAIAPGSKMQYLDEWVVGFEREFGQGVIFSARYVDRRLKRAVEDMAGISPEAALAGAAQVYFIANPGPDTDLFVNPQQNPFVPTFDPNDNVLLVSGYSDADGPCNPSAANPGCVLDGSAVASLIPDSCFTVFNPATNTFRAPFVGVATDSDLNLVGAEPGICVNPAVSFDGTVNYLGGAEPGALGGDGLPDGFVRPRRDYQAVEFEVNKSFSKNWQLRTNWRIAKLKGNYEGAFRNDNGQTDPSISSLFDFTAGDYNLLGDQFAIGYLNTDRRHVVNTFFSYVFDKTALKGLTLGTSVRVETGVPINSLAAHPVYTNAGEIPLGGRGAGGRLPTTGTVDLHADYAFSLTEKSRLRFGVDLFNIANMQRLTRTDERLQRTVGTPNADYLKPRGNLGAFQRPFYGRLMVKFEF